MTYSAEGITQIRREEEAALARWVAIRIQPDHQRCGHDGRDNAYEHDETAVIPFVAEPAHRQDDNSTDDAARYVKDKLWNVLASAHIQYRYSRTDCWDVYPNVVSKMLEKLLSPPFGMEVSMTLRATSQTRMS